MDLNKISEIVQAKYLNDEQKKTAICIEIARDPNAIPTILRILNAERSERKELVGHLNLLLSKAHIGLENPKSNKDGFMQKEISEFYKTGRISHCFKEIE